MSAPLGLTPSQLHELSLALKPSVIVLTILAVFTSMLIPLLFALVYFSTDQTRHTAVYGSVLVTVLVGIGVGTWGMYNSFQAILFPLQGISSSAYIAYGIAIGFVGFLVDVVLLFRVIAVFPPSSTPRRKFALIIAPAVILKLIRIAGWIWFGLQFMHDRAAGRDTHLSYLGFAVTDPNSRAMLGNYLMHMISTTLDNMYASIVFMRKLASHWRTPFNRVRVSDSWSHKLRTLFWLAATNFVLPVILNLVQLGLRLSGSGEDYYVLVANTQISIICAVFATVWSSDESSRGGVSDTASNPAVLGVKTEPLRFAPPSISISPTESDLDLELSTVQRRHDVTKADGEWEI